MANTSFSVLKQQVSALDRLLLTNAVDLSIVLCDAVSWAIHSDVTSEN